VSGGLRVAGLTRLSTVDFPGRLAAVVFLQGCPWRCSYCHNPGLIPADAPTPLTWADASAFLARRRGLLDGVVFSGGEPTLQAALPAAMDEARALGLQLGLHTAGMYPDRVAALLPRLDWVGLDIKARDPGLSEVTGVRGGAARVRATLGHLQASSVDHECRTTWHPALYPADELLALADDLAAAGVTRWAVQAARLPGQPQARVSAELASALSARFPHVILR